LPIFISPADEFMETTPSPSISIAPSLYVFIAIPPLPEYMFVIPVPPASELPTCITLFPAAPILIS